MSEKQLTTQPKILEAPQNDNDVVLSVQGVSKKFCRDLKRSLVYGVQDIGSELLGLRGATNDTLRKGEFWALQDVSFELRRGEALGLVGKNGSGKSTLLRVIAGLIKPDKGEVIVSGRVAPLIALGAGFNPVLTGRENIYANMSILGLSKEEIDERFDEVVEFAEIGEAIDSPVQTYSSGMQARLGFSCAVHTAPDILLIDEALAVGDIRFRAKCYRKLSHLRAKRTAFVLVSHNALSIFTACTSAVYLSAGKFIASGEPAVIMDKYENDLFLSTEEKVLGSLKLPEKSDTESYGLDITSISFKDLNGKHIASPMSGQPTTLCIECNAKQHFAEVDFHLSIQELGAEGDLSLFLSNLKDKKPLEIYAGKHEIQLKMPYLGLKPGTYSMKIFVREGLLDTLDTVESFKFQVTSTENMSHCQFFQPRDWLTKT